MSLSIDLPDELIAEITRRVMRELDRGDPQAEPWIDADQAAQHLACNRRRIYDLVSQRAISGIPVRKEGSRLLFKRSALDSWIERGGMS